LQKISLSGYSDRVKKIREGLGLRIADFARQLGVPRSTLVGWEEGKSVSIEILKTLEETFAVNINWFLTGEGEMLVNAPKPAEPKTPDVKEAIGCLVDEQMAPKLSEIESRMAKQDAAIAKLGALVQRQQQEAAPPPLYEAKGAEESGVEESEPGYEEEETERVLYVYDIAAGLPIEQSEDLSERRAVPARHIKTSARDYYAARIRGESMTEAGIPDGCVALIRLSDVPRDGAIQVVRRGHRSTLKRMAEGPGGKWRLLYEDGSGRYIDMAEDDWRVQGDFVAVVEGGE
jgi:DNA polymerase V